VIRVSECGGNEWVVSLWLNNDEGAQNWANEVMQGVEDHKRGESLRDWFDESFVEEIPNEFTRGIVRDMINHTDWDEIAEAVFVEE
jgi:hypothetical protein